MSELFNKIISADYSKTLEKTKEFLPDNQITIDIINRRFKKIAEEIKIANKWNYSDINVICEEIFGQLLKELYGWNFTATSAYISGNYAAVDLIDFKSKVAVQVTSRSDRTKIMGSVDKNGNVTKKGTVQKFRENDDLNGIEKLYILILGYKDAYKKPYYEDMKNGRVFSLLDDVIDFDVLIDKIRERQSEPGFLAKIYQYTTLIENTGRLQYHNVIQESCMNLQSNKTEFAWRNGTSSLLLVAMYTSKGNDIDVSAQLTFSDQELYKVVIDLSKDIITKRCFGGYENFLAYNSNGRLITDEVVTLKFPNIQLLNININTAWHVYDLFRQMEADYNNRINHLSTM